MISQSLENYRISYVLILVNTLKNVTMPAWKHYDSVRMNHHSLIIFVLIIYKRLHQVLSSRRNMNYKLYNEAVFANYILKTRFFTVILCNQSGCMTQLTEGRNGIQIVGFHGYSPVAERGFLLAVYKNGDT